jgi:hypothetical protein
MQWIKKATRIQMEKRIQAITRREPKKQAKNKIIDVKEK